MNKFIFNQNSLDRYAEIKNQIKALDEEAEKLKPEVIDSLRAIETKAFKSAIGQFLIIKRKVWKYSEGFKKKVAKLKDKEEKDGTATFTESEGITYLNNEQYQSISENDNH